jgi:hypothetical protein
MYPIVGLRGGARIVANFNVGKGFGTPVFLPDFSKWAISKPDRLKLGLRSRIFETFTLSVGVAAGVANLAIAIFEISEAIKQRHYL